MSGPWVLDICSGLGGASEAFAKDPYWTVIRVDNAEKVSHVAHTRVLDILGWLDWLPDLISEMGTPDVIIAGPPCREFSRAYQAPAPRAERLGIAFEPDMRLLEACIDIVEYVNPPFHIIENVAGAIHHFGVYLGKYRQKVGPFYLWGKFPHLAMPMNFAHSKYENDSWSTDPLRANKRAMWPLDLSEALLDAVSQQSTLSDWA